MPVPVPVGRGVTVPVGVRAAVTLRDADPGPVPTVVVAVADIDVDAVGLTDGGGARQAPSTSRHPSAHVRNPRSQVPSGRATMSKLSQEAREAASPRPPTRGGPPGTITLARSNTTGPAWTTWGSSTATASRHMRMNTNSQLN